MKTKLIKLNNGGELLYYPRRTSRATMITLTFKAGYLNEPYNKKGLAHFCEHAIMSFSTKTKTQKMKNKINNELLIAASTNTSYITFHYLGLYEEVMKALDFLMDSILNLTYNQEEFEREKSIILNEINYKKSKEIDELSVFLPKIYMNKYAKHFELSSIGDEKTLKNIKINDVKEFKENFITLNNLTAMIGGNASAKQAKQIAKILNKLPSSNHKGTIIQDLQTFRQPFYTLVHDKNAHQTTICLRYRFHPIKNGFDLKTDLFYTIINASMHGLLNKYFREEKGLCYSVHSYPENIGNSCFLRIEIPSNASVENLLENYNTFIANLTKDNLKKAYDFIIKDMLKQINFDSMPLYATCKNVLNNYQIYHRLSSSNLDDEKMKIIKNFDFEDFYLRIKETLSSKPYLSIVSNDETLKDFDYKAFTKNLKLNLK